MSGASREADEVCGGTRGADGACGETRPVGGGETCLAASNSVFFWMSASMLEICCILVVTFLLR